MTKEQAKELLPIITAFAEGKTIQRLIYFTWVDNTEFEFSNLPENYRIKPEPREFWLCDSHIYKNEQMAIQHKISFPGLEVIHVKEI